MNIPDLLKDISERISTSAGVKVIYGEPIAAEGKTIIPVARVSYGFGGGGGIQQGNTTSTEADVPSSTGGGGGGGASVSPVGVHRDHTG